METDNKFIENKNPSEETKTDNTNHEVEADMKLDERYSDEEFDEVVEIEL